MDKIFPEEIIEFSAEEHFFRYSVRWQPTTVFFMLMLVGFIISLPLIKLDITYSTRGILRTAEEATRIIVPREGKVEFNAMELGKFVCEGDTLLILNHTSISDELADTDETTLLLISYMSDLETLISGSGIPQTVRYKQVLMEYSHEFSRLKSEYNYALDEYKTNKDLYENGFVARLEYEAYRRRYLASESLIKVREKEFQNRWQTELAAYKIQFLQLSTKHSYLQQSKEMHILLAPVSGYLCDYSEIKPGSFLTVNSVIARIVPDQELIASCLVSPEKISRISLGQKVKLNIDAYPGSSYGRIEGLVETIPEDASIYSGSHGFPITCKINQEFEENLTLQDARLKSGMTFTGFFIISRKSLWQLIIEKGERLLIPTPSQADHEKKRTIKS